MAELAPLQGADSPSRIENNYIVAFKDELSAEDVTMSLAAIKELFETEGKGNCIKREFNIGKFRAFSAVMTDSTRDKVRAMSSIKYVEYDQGVSVDPIKSEQPPQ